MNILGFLSLAVGGKWLLGKQIEANEDEMVRRESNAEISNRKPIDSEKEIDYEKELQEEDEKFAKLWYKMTEKERITYIENQDKLTAKVNLYNENVNKKFLETEKRCEVLRKKQRIENEEIEREIRRL